MRSEEAKQRALPGMDSKNPKLAAERGRGETRGGGDPAGHWRNVRSRSAPQRTRSVCLAVRTGWICKMQDVTPIQVFLDDWGTPIPPKDSLTPRAAAWPVGNCARG